MKRTVRTHLVEERKSRQWSQQELADLVGTTQHNVSRWEAGLTTPGPYFRAKLCELFGMSAQALGLLDTISVLAYEKDAQIVMRLPDTPSGFESNVRQVALTGPWDGAAHQQGGGDFRVTLHLSSTGCTFQGTGHIHSIYQSRNITQPIIVSGEFVYDRFLKLEYTLQVPPGSIQFGFVLLEFTPDGQALHGCFLGYGALVTNGMVTGTVHLQKQRTELMTIVTL